MKPSYIIFLALSCVAAASAGPNSHEFLKHILPKTPASIKAFADKLGVENSIRSVLVSGILSNLKNGARVPVIPAPEEDSIALPDPINISQPDKDQFIFGDVSVRGGVIEGFSSLKDDLTLGIALLPPKVSLGYKIDLAKLSLNGDYTSDSTLNWTYLWWALRPIEYGGDGAFHLNANGAFIELGASAAIRKGTIAKIDFKDIKIDFGFEALQLFFENASVDGYPVPVEYWQEVDEFLSEVIPWFIEPLTTYLEETVSFVLNDMFEDCTIFQLIAFLSGTGDLSCIKLPELS